MRNQFGKLNANRPAPRAYQRSNIDPSGIGFLPAASLDGFLAASMALEGGERSWRIDKPRACTVSVPANEWFSQ
jgi:hypothetical protein